VVALLLVLVPFATRTLPEFFVVFYLLTGPSRLLAPLAWSVLLLCVILCLEVVQQSGDIPARRTLNTDAIHSGLGVHGGKNGRIRTNLFLKPRIVALNEPSS